MSRAIGISSAQFMGARIAGQLTYVPAHNKNGKDINQRCMIPVYVNSNKGTGRDGQPGRSDQFRLVAWGKLADICARSLSKGKALDCICTPGSYEGRIYDTNGNMRVDNTGQPITVERVGFTIQSLVFGEDSQKEIDLEIQVGKRPINWNNPQHPDYQTWISVLQQRQATQHMGGNEFGFARVVIASGPGITTTTGQNTTGGGFTQAAVNTMPANPANANVDPNLIAAAVAQVLNTGGGQAPPVQPLGNVASGGVF